MADLLASIEEKIKAFGGNWATYSVVGSFALYVQGYLALRFHLTVLGVGTDLNVLDERYLFAGAEFLIFLVSTAATLIFLALLLAAPIYGLYRLLALLTAGRSIAWIARAGCWIAAPPRLAIIGIVFSVAMIQLVMNNCLAYSNIVLSEKLPPGRLSDWLLQEDQIFIALYFYGMVGAAMLASAILLKLRNEMPQPSVPAGVWRLFAFLVAVQWLLLPVNYGYLLMDKQMPRVASLDCATPMPQGREAWLVWESKDKLTFLLRNRNEKPEGRSLRTVPNDQVKTIEIVAYDPLFPTLFGPPITGE